MQYRLSLSPKSMPMVSPAAVALVSLLCFLMAGSPLHRFECVPQLIAVYGEPAVSSHLSPNSARLHPLQRALSNLRKLRTPSSAPTRVVEPPETPHALIRSNARCRTSGGYFRHFPI